MEIIPEIVSFYFFIPTSKGSKLSAACVHSRFQEAFWATATP